jgi:hypothetical protein
MAYNTVDRRAEQNTKQDDMLASKRFVIERKPDTNLFYELEEAIQYFHQPYYRSILGLRI